MDRQTQHEQDGQKSSWDSWDTSRNSFSDTHGTTKNAFPELNAHPAGIWFFKGCSFKDIWISNDLHFRISKEAAE